MSNAEVPTEVPESVAAYVNGWDGTRIKMPPMEAVQEFVELSELNARGGLTKEQQERFSILERRIAAVANGMYY